MNTKFTPGPWRAERTIDNCCREGEAAVWGSVLSANDFYVARIWNDIEEDRDETEPRANAHLIAAAPDMYGALQTLLSDLEGYEAWEKPGYALALAETALKKARGEA